MKHRCTDTAANCAETFNQPGAAILYDQTDAATGNGAPDQAFEASYAAYSCEAADDFVVTDALGWDITGVNSLGSLNGPGAAAFVNITFFADNAGLPADTAVSGCEFLGTTDFTNSAGDLAITLEGCNLAPGTYWVAQSVRMDFNPNGQHFFSDRSTTSNTAAVWRNPGDGFGAGCIDWTNKVACGVGAANGTDFLFQIAGEIRTPNGPGGVPALGPLGVLLTVLALGGGSGYVLARRRQS
jgi:hypothetical protein